MYINTYSAENSAYVENRTTGLTRVKRKTALPPSPDILKSCREIIVNSTVDTDLDQPITGPFDTDLYSSNYIIKMHTISLKAVVVNRAVVKMDIDRPNIVYTVKNVYHGTLNAPLDSPRDRNGDVILSENVIADSSFTPSSALSAYISRNTRDRSIFLYRPIALDAYHVGYVRKCSDGYPASRFAKMVPGFLLDNIVRVQPFYQNSIQDHKIAVEMCVPEPQYYTAFHNFMHKQKFAMEEAVSVSVANNLLDEQTEITVLDSNQCQPKVQYYDINRIKLRETREIHYETMNLRSLIYDSISPAVSEYARHQMKRLIFSYDSMKKRFNVDKIESGYAFGPPSLILDNSLMLRLIGQQKDKYGEPGFSDGSIIEPLEMIHNLFGPFMITCLVTDPIIKIRIRFSNNIGSKSDVAGIDMISSIGYLISVMNNGLTDVIDPIKIL